MVYVWFQIGTSQLKVSTQDVIVGGRHGIFCMCSAFDTLHKITWGGSTTMSLKN